LAGRAAALFRAVTLPDEGRDFRDALTGADVSN